MLHVHAMNLFLCRKKLSSDEHADFLECLSAGFVLTDAPLRMLELVCDRYKEGRVGWAAGQASDVCLHTPDSNPGEAMRVSGVFDDNAAEVVSYSWMKPGFGETLQMAADEYRKAAIIERELKAKVVGGLGVAAAFSIAGFLAGFLAGRRCARTV